MADYLNPPLAKVKCKVVFDSEEKWTNLLPFHVYDVVKEDFPNLEESQKESFEQSPLSFLSKEKDARIELGYCEISFTKYKPYTWESYFQLLSLNLEKLLKIVNSEKISYIELEFVNRMEFDAQELSLSRYLQTYPTFFNQSTFTKRAFALIFNNDIDENTKGLALLTDTTPDNPKNVAFNLSLKHVRSFNEGVNQDDTLKTIKELHDFATKLFEDLITDELRNQFKGN